MVIIIKIFFNSLRLIIDLHQSKKLKTTDFINFIMFAIIAAVFTTIMGFLIKVIFKLIFKKTLQK